MKTLEFEFDLILYDTREDIASLFSGVAGVEAENLVNRGDLLLFVPSEVSTLLNVCSEKARPHRDENLFMKVKVNEIQFEVPFSYRKSTKNTWTDIRCKFLLALLERV